jgi:hypothetical protein
MIAQLRSITVQPECRRQQFVADRCGLLASLGRRFPVFSWPLAADNEDCSVPMQTRWTYFYEAAALRRGQLLVGLAN